MKEIRRFAGAINASGPERFFLPATGFLFT